MPLIISKNSIEAQIREESKRRADVRRQEDVASGLTIGKGPQRGDFRICREGEKIMKEYKDHKDPKAREQIKREYFQMQKEHRRG
jgi:hypothetical protein